MQLSGQASLHQPQETQASGLESFGKTPLPPGSPGSALMQPAGQIFIQALQEIQFFKSKSGFGHSDFFCLLTLKPF
jgi:hypothetical protein